MAETVLAKMAVEISANAANFQKQLSTVDTKLNTVGKTAIGIGNILKGALAGISLAALGREVINVTAEFQKFEAVLTNTLGSNSAAKIALRDIEEFAKRTPFSVEELTQSFVKLANQGFQPTTDQLTNLGDLASSTGKSFDQLAEAIIDAQTGEFERLKEFGIRASKQGDQVKFTFKGVQTQVKFTSDEIQKYILSLGEAEGVSGAMAAISETLGGQISNLGDSWSQFLKVIGDGNKGALSVATKGLSALLASATEFIKTNRQVQEEAQVDSAAAAIDDLKDLAKITGDLDASAVKVISTLELEKEALSDQAQSLFANFEANEKTIEGLNNRAVAIEYTIQAIKDYVKAEDERVAKELQNDKKLDSIKKKKVEKIPPPDSVNAYQAAIAKLSEEIENANVKDLERIRILSAEIQGYKDAIEKVEQLRKSFEDTDVIIPIPDLSPLAINMEAIGVRFDAILAKAASSAKTHTQTIKDAFIELTPLIGGALSGIGEALGNAIAGIGNFGEDILKVVATFGKQLGEILIAQGVALLAAKFALKNPYTAIAAGVALVAISSALSSSISKAHSATVGGPGTTASRSTAGDSINASATQAQDVRVAGETVIRGQDLYVIFSNYQNNNKFTRAGG
jgi:hypothetical protein